MRYKCDLCNEEYKRKDYLSRHMKSVHSSRTSTQAAPSSAIPNQDTEFNPESDFDLDMFVDNTSSPPVPEGPVIKGSTFFTDVCNARSTCSQTER